MTENNEKQWLWQKAMGTSWHGNEFLSTVEEIKKSIRKNGVDHYSCNNIYIILQDALKKVTLSGN